MTIEAYPLHWPTGWPRTEKPRSSRFDTSLADARDGLLEEIRRLGGRNVIISTNQETYRRGGQEIPYAKQMKMAEDCGAAVYFNLNGEPQVFACDRWDRLQDNIQAMRLTIAALRGIDRWGSSEMMKRVFTGFAALPETAGSHNDDEWWQALGLDGPDQDRETIKRAYREKARQFHPDLGGTNEDMSKINDALETANRLFETMDEEMQKWARNKNKNFH